jgi:O-methyltransferase
VAQSRKLSGSGIEIGVWRGGTGALIAQQAKASGIHERVAGVVKASTKDSDHRGGEHADTSAQIVASLLDSLSLGNAVIVEGIFPERTASSIEDTSFRFCHIDVDAYRSAKDCVDWLWPRLTVGGIIVCDDFGCEHCDGIARYVEEQLPERDRLIVQNLNGHAVVIKLG